MIPRRTYSKRCLGAATAAALILSGWEAMAGVQVSYQYNLSDFQGPVVSQWALVTVDPEEGEVYALNRNESAIQIYNGSGMQTFSFGEGLNLAGAADLSAGEGGEMFVLLRYPTERILHLDYAGRPLEEISLRGVPEGFRPFRPDYLDYRDGRFYLADGTAMRLVVTSGDGAFERGYDARKALAEPLEAALKEPGLDESRQKRLEKDLDKLREADLTGFAAGADGNLYFTVATQFSAFRLPPGGKLERFGVAGGAPGKFGVVAGIQADSQGNVYVADRLRCAVLVFDRDFNFLTEFGYRGTRPENLVVPDDLALDGRRGRVYVSQAANRGVSVFDLKFN